VSNCTGFLPTSDVIYFGCYTKKHHTGAQMKKDFLAISDYSSDEIQMLLDLA
jgi:hypothetical protein